MVLSGPSGVGKDAVLGEVRRRGFPCHDVVTATTRPQREGEGDGVDYYFLTDAKFQEMKERGELLEWAEVYGHWYGVRKSQVEGPLSQGQDVIMKMDIQGAATIKRLFPNSVLIFIAPPSFEELARRLRQRKTESGIDLEVRLRTAKEEMKSLPLFDYIVVNEADKLGIVVSEIQAIITAERRKVESEQDAESNGGAMHPLE